LIDDVFPENELVRLPMILPPTGDDPEPDVPGPIGKALTTIPVFVEVAVPL
jgi:hypothetical protein